MATSAKNTEKDDWQSADDWQSEKKARPSKLESFVRGAGQGLSLGFEDELRAFALSHMPGEKRSYEEIRDDIRGKNKAAEEENPKTFKGSEVVGMIAPSLVPGLGEAGLLEKIPAAAKAVASGAAYGLGKSEKSDVGGQAVDTAVGAGGGLIGHGMGLGLNKVGSAVSEAAQPYIENASNKLEDFAAKRAAKQSGMMLKDERALNHQGRLKDMGDWLLDKGVVSPLSSVNKVAERARDARMDIGSKMGNVESAIDDYASHVGTEGGGLTVDPQNIADDIRNVADALRKSPAKQQYASALDKHADFFENTKEPLTFSKMNEIKRDYDDVLNWETEQGVPKELLKKVRGIVNDHANEQAEKVSRLSGMPAADQWSGLNKEYGLAAKAQEMAEDKISRNDTNRWLSPSDYGSIIGGGLIGAGTSDRGENKSLEYALLAGAGNRFARGYGNALAATGAKALASGIKQLPEIGAKFGQSLSEGPGMGLLGAGSATKKFKEAENKKADDFESLPDRAPQSGGLLDKKDSEPREKLNYNPDTFDPMNSDPKKWKEADERAKAWDALPLKDRIEINKARGFNRDRQPQSEGGAVELPDLPRPSGPVTVTSNNEPEDQRIDAVKEAPDYGSSGLANMLGKASSVFKSGLVQKPEIPMSETEKQIKHNLQNPDAPLTPEEESDLEDEQRIESEDSRTEPSKHYDPDKGYEVLDSPDEENDDEETTSDARNPQSIPAPEDMSQFLQEALGRQIPQNPESFRSSYEFQKEAPQTKGRPSLNPEALGERGPGEKFLQKKENPFFDEWINRKMKDKMKTY